MAKVGSCKVMCFMANFSGTVDLTIPTPNSTPFTYEVKRHDTNAHLFTLNTSVPILVGNKVSVAADPTSPKLTVRDVLFTTDAAPILLVE